MKKTLFFAFAAALTAVSCSQFEAVETVTPENNAATLVGAVIGDVDSKTTLGEKDGASYPILWQAGDAIVVNGCTSQPLQSSSINGQSAVFAFDDVLSGALSAVAPASALGTDGLVTIPTVQAYTKGSYDPAAGIMLGAGTVDALAFTSAVSFLKVTPTGSADNIVKVSVASLGNESLSGKFSIDNGALVLANGCAGVTVTTTSPVAAGTPFIVVIPAQTYASGIQVTIQDANGYITSKSSAKAFTAEAGKIYTTEIEYAPAVAKAAISIDGDFSDWKNAPAVSYCLPVDYARYTILREMKFTSDKDYVYMYAEIDETDSQFGAVRGLPVDLFIDADANTATGGYLTSTDNVNTDLPYTASGLEWYIEPGGIHSEGRYIDFTWGAYEYTGLDGGSIWSLANRTGSYGSAQMFACSSYDQANGIGYIEIKMERSFFKMTGDKAAFGMKLMDGNDNWNCLGLLPQAAGTPEHHGRADMAVVALEPLSAPEPVVVEPITIDGDFSDWASVSTVATLPDDAAFIALKTLKLAASSDKLFIYLEVDEREGLSFAMPADFYIDADGNTSTGGKLTSTDNQNVDLPYTDSGLEWYIEHGAFHDAGSATGYYDWSQGGAYHYEGADGAGIFSALSNKSGQYGAAQMFAVGNFDEATMTGQVEIMFDREYFGITGEKASVGVKLMDGMNGWACYGLLPQGAKKSAGHHTAADMLTINLPVYAK